MVELAMADDAALRGRRGWRSTARGPRTRPTRCASSAAAPARDELFAHPRRRPGRALAHLARARGGAGAGDRRGRGASTWSRNAIVHQARPAERRRADPLPRHADHARSPRRSVRRRVAEGRPIRYLVPDEVADYIAEHELYGRRPSSAGRTGRRRERDADARPRWPSGSRRSPPTARRSTSA